MHRPGGFTERVAVPSSALHELARRTCRGDRGDGRAAGQRRARPVQRGAGRRAPARHHRLGNDRAGVPAGGQTARFPDVTWWTGPGSDSPRPNDSGPPRASWSFRRVRRDRRRRRGRGDARRGISHLRPGGTAVWLGLAESDSGFDGNLLVRSEHRVVGSFAYSPDDFTAALAMAGRLDLSWWTAGRWRIRWPRS